MKSMFANAFKTNVTKEQCRDTGMALVLVLLICLAVFKNTAFVPWAIVALVINMTAPRLYRPLAIVWLGFAHLLGTVMSKVILSIVFFLVVTPIALLRKMAGKDSLQLLAFKASRESAMVVRNHTFTAKDIEKPY
jgi:hypothetical protein